MIIIGSSIVDYLIFFINFCLFLESSIYEKNLNFKINVILLFIIFNNTINKTIVYFFFFS